MSPYLASKFIISGLLIFYSGASFGSAAFSNLALGAQRLYTSNPGLATSSIGCLSCHDTAAMAGNYRKFGNDMRTAGLTGATTTASQMNMHFQAVANIDSDGDGATNDAEFKANTDPGNIASKPGGGGPVATATPTPTPTPPPVAPTPPVGGGSAGGSDAGSLGTGSNNRRGGALSSGCGAKTSDLRMRLHDESDSIDNWSSPQTAATGILFILPLFVAVGLRRKK